MNSTRPSSVCLAACCCAVPLQRKRNMCSAHVSSQCNRFISGSLERTTRGVGGGARRKEASAEYRANGMLIEFLFARYFFAPLPIFLRRVVCVMLFREPEKAICFTDSEKLPRSGILLFHHTHRRVCVCIWSKWERARTRTMASYE